MSGKEQQKLGIDGTVNDKITVFDGFLVCQITTFMNNSRQDGNVYGVYYFKTMVNHYHAL